MQNPRKENVGGCEESQDPERGGSQPWSDGGSATMGKKKKLKNAWIREVAMFVTPSIEKVESRSLTLVLREGEIKRQRGKKEARRKATCIAP